MKLLFNNSVIMERLQVEREKKLFNVLFVVDFTTERVCVCATFRPQSVACTKG